MKTLSKKGFIGGAMGGAIVTVFGLFVIGILIFAFAIAGSTIMGSTTDATAKSVINNTVQGASAYANFSTVNWTMAAIGLMLAILFGSIGAYLVGRTV